MLTFAARQLLALSAILLLEFCSYAPALLCCCSAVHLLLHLYMCCCCNTWDAVVQRCCAACAVLPRCCTVDNDLDVNVVLRMLHKCVLEYCGAVHADL